MQDFKDLFGKGVAVVRSGSYGGIEWAINATKTHLNGYVRVPDGVCVNKDLLSVHGEITFDDPDSGWIGFDTWHLYDVWTPEELRRVVPVSPATEAILEQTFDLYKDGPVRFWTLEKMIEEVLNLCWQVRNFARPAD